MPFVLRHIPLLAVLFGIFLFGGCGPDTPKTYAPVSGKITIDGEPLVGAKVVFVPYRFRDENHESIPYSFGITDEKGNYKLKMDNNIMGASIGKHAVFITTAETIPISESAGTKAKTKNKSGTAKTKTKKSSSESDSGKKSAAGKTDPGNSAQKASQKKKLDKEKPAGELPLKSKSKEKPTKESKPGMRRKVIQEETIQSQYNSNTRLEFTVKSGTSNQANFALKSHPE